MIDLSRKELDKIAKDLGLNPKDYNNKEEIVEAIELAQEPKEEKNKPWDGSFHTRS